jgi:hypothetical protein
MQFTKKIRNVVDPPAFSFIRCVGDPVLYKLEDATIKSLHAIAEHRVDRYKEDYWKQAIPEAISSVLNNFSLDVVFPAIRHRINSSDY